MTDHRGVDAAEAVLAAAHRRAAALATGRAADLSAVLHPAFRWTSHRGEVFDRHHYIAANTAGTLVWRRQEVLEPAVVVVGSTAVLTAVVVDEVERDGVPVTYRMPVTQTWVHVEGVWLCLAGHAGPLLPS